MTALIKIRN